MKKVLKKIIICGICILTGQQLFAQDVKLVCENQEAAQGKHIYLNHYKFWDNWFLSAQVGVSHSMSENTRFGNFFKNEKPSFKINAGKWFYPSFGTRVTVGYYPQVGRAEWELCDIWPEHFGNYDFGIMAAYVDGMLNFTNIISQYRENRRFNLIGFIGIGYNRSVYFDNKRLDTWKVPYNGQVYNVDTKHGNYLAAHVGLQAAYKISEPWDITLEASYNGTDDKYNGVEYDRVYDAYVNVMLGVNYRFKNSDNHHRFKYVYYDNTRFEALIDRLMERSSKDLELAQLPVEELVEHVHFNEALQTTISFYIDRYYITDVQKRNVASVAKFIESHPNVNLIVTGYADVETAYPEYNMKLSQRRAKAVYDCLVNEFNVDPSRLRVDYKGDVVQPYADVNEWNRAVVFIMERR